jgi:hypothetical protein
MALTHFELLGFDKTTYNLVISRITRGMRQVNVETKWHQDLPSCDTFSSTAEASHGSRADCHYSQSSTASSGVPVVTSALRDLLQCCCV